MIFYIINTELYKKVKWKTLKFKMRTFRFLTSTSITYFVLDRVTENTRPAGSSVASLAEPAYFLSGWKFQPRWHNLLRGTNENFSSAWWNSWCLFGLWKYEEYFEVIRINWGYSYLCYLYRPGRRNLQFQF